jgi:hypothetical protein
VGLTSIQASRDAKGIAQRIEKFLLKLFGYNDEIVFVVIPAGFLSDDQVSELVKIHGYSLLDPEHERFVVFTPTEIVCVVGLGRREDFGERDACALFGTWRLFKRATLPTFVLLAIFCAVAVVIGAPTFGRAE